MRWGCVPVADLLCGFCKRPPEEHADSDAGPMSVCPVQAAWDSYRRRLASKAKYRRKNG